MGQKEKKLDGINIAVTRGGPQITHDQIEILTTTVTDTKIKQALDGIGDNKAPGIDGYNARFFKDIGSVINKDVCEAVKDFSGTTES